MQVTAPFHVAFLRLEPERLRLEAARRYQRDRWPHADGRKRGPMRKFGNDRCRSGEREYVQTWRRGSSTIPDSPSPDERGGNLDINSSTKELDEAGHHLLQSPVAPKRPQEASKDKIVRIV